MLQLVYISTAVGTPSGPAILAVSRRNNRRAEISGLLYADGKRFLQALEGPQEMVEQFYERIRRDPRHRAPVVLSRRVVAEREFGDWDMAERLVGEDADAFLARVEELVAGADPSVRATFDGLAQMRRAA